MRNHYQHLIGKYITVRNRKEKITEITEYEFHERRKPSSFIPKVVLVAGMVQVRTSTGRLYELAPTGRVDEILSDGVELYRVGNHRFDLETIT